MTNTTKPDLIDKISITIQEASELTSISYRQIAEWAETDETFPVFKVGSKRIIELSALQEWLRTRCACRVGMPSARVMRVIRRKNRKQG